MITDMSVKPFKISYDSGYDNILENFYIPALSSSNSYDRIAGFFSSSSLALAARGMEEFLIHGGVMRLVTCPQLTPSDIKLLESSNGDLDALITEHFIDDMDNIADRFEQDHVKALGWMLSRHKLEIKIAVIRKNGHICSSDEIEELGIMHQKVGVFRDQAGNIMSFSGSLNESASGWLGNSEEFKVFMSWQGMMPFINGDIAKFNSFWNDSRPDCEVKTLPQAIQEHLIRASSDFEPKHLNIKRYRRALGFNEITGKETLELFPYQKEAVQKWKDNNKRLLLQMATGTGKTRTALGCLREELKIGEKTLIVIATPQPTLTDQWISDSDKLELGIEHTLNLHIPKWATQLKKQVFMLSTGQIKHLVVFTTHDICSSKKFIEILNATKPKVKKFLIGDEVHEMGASEMRKGLLECYDYRLGLSATPERWFDDEGTELIHTYFGGDVYEFPISRALREVNPRTNRTFLVNYYYRPRFVHLTDDELERYTNLTKKISKMSCMNKEELYDCLQFLRFQRADIEKTAEAKYRDLEKILDGLGNDLTDTIIFTNPEQLPRVMKTLGDRRISAARYTEKESTHPSPKYGGLSERQYILELFRERKYQVLVAITCLDEGIDIPTAKRAIIMASSTNPREYVQRIGRVIRQAPGKKDAEIYDMIIIPDLSRCTDTQLEMEKRIFNKEMTRVIDLSENALNNTTVANMCYKIKQEALNYG